MDWWKVVIVVVLIVVIVALLGKVAGLEIFGSAGIDSLWALAAPAEDQQGDPTDWAPIDVGRDLFATLFTAGLAGDGMTIDVWAVLTGAFGAAFTVVGISVLIKILGKVTGG